MLATAGCVAPALHPVEIADSGHVTALASIEAGGSLQADARLGVGVAPHLQIEGEGTLANGDAFGAGGGARVQLPVVPVRADGSAEVSLQLAALYRHVQIPIGTGCGHDAWFYPETCGPSAGIDTAMGEVGLVGRVGQGASVAWGLWAASGIGRAHGKSNAGEYGGTTEPYVSTVVPLTLGASLEIPMDHARRASALLGVTWQRLFVGPYSTAPEPDAWGFGLGMVLRF